VGAKRPESPRTLPLLALLLGLMALTGASGIAVAQGGPPGVRGALYESPTYGWIVVAPEPDWEIADAGSEDGRDWVRLTSTAGDGAENILVSYLDDGRGTEGCVRDLVDQLAAAFPEHPLEGWRGPEVEFTGQGEATTYARVVRDQGPGLDILAFIQCHQESGKPLLIGDMLLQTNRDNEASTVPSTSLLYWPGELHTGRARGASTPEAGSGSGVVIFGSLSAPLLLHFPLNCMNQEDFSPPARPLPPDRGYFSCQGQITNVDTIPATIDLNRLVMGCERVPAGEPLPAGCTGELVAPASYDLLQAPDGEDGPALTLAPGEAAQIVLWYVLPEGDVPVDIYYLDEDGQPTVLAGTSFFSQGTGTRPKLRLSR
jgi:hypothetical protein